MTFTKFNDFKKVIINYFSKLDRKIIKLMKSGLKFSFIILIVSIAILITYLLFIHTNIVYQIGLLIFQISLYIGADFIISGVAVDIINKQLQ